MPIIFIPIVYIVNPFQLKVPIIQHRTGIDMRTWNLSLVEKYTQPFRIVLDMKQIRHISDQCILHSFYLNHAIFFRNPTQLDFFFNWHSLIT